LENDTAPSFPIETSLTYKLLGVRNLSKVGKGLTIDISSKRITFTPERELPSGVELELMIKWPALLNGSVGIELVLCGVVISGDQSATTMEIVRYKFRTKS
jgi:hypothetical protein